MEDKESVSFKGWGYVKDWKGVVGSIGTAEPKKELRWFVLYFMIVLVFYAVLFVGFYYLVK